MQLGFQNIFIQVPQIQIPVAQSGYISRKKSTCKEEVQRTGSALGELYDVALVLYSVVCYYRTMW